MSERLQYGTKYVKKSDLRYFEDGQIRFGPIEEYRAVEHKAELGARSDEGEGNYPINIRVPFSGANARLPIVQQDGSRKFLGMAGSLKGISGYTTQTHNYRLSKVHLFCACIGGYSTEQHNRMQYGEGDYKGSSQLDSYVVFDVIILFEAVMREMQKRAALRGSEFQSHQIHRNFVEYQRKPYEFTIESKILPNNFLNSPIVWERLLFSKRLMFAPEDEFRMVIKSADVVEEYELGNSLLIKSDVVKRAITEMGSR